ncbi:hypothetical protein NL108_015431 [Boleophthalmus pectinirostris]|nr:hypothetical protein NL108_015431 [Boleophthalmus pectinirostris]
MVLFGLITAIALVHIQQVQTIEVQHVHLGGTVSLVCNLTSFYNVAWFKENPYRPPTLVVFINLRKGDMVYGYQAEPRFTAEFVHRTLTITDITENDLGLYFCAVCLNTELLIGSGIIIQGPFHFGFYHWYCSAVGGGLLFMVVSVCVVHCKTKDHRKNPLIEEQKDQNNSDIYAVPHQQTQAILHVHI